MSPGLGLGAASTPTGASPGPRAAYPGSRAGSANLVGKGHDSWEVWQLSRLELPLRTGW